MRILITGCAGTMGSIITQPLARAGYDVRGIDIRRCDYEGVDTRVCDLLDPSDLAPHLEGVDAIVHLANQVRDRVDSDNDLFRLNVGGTFTVLQACAERGIRKAIVASSPNAIGFQMGVRDSALDYVPVDGAHRAFTSDPYSYSKETIEAMGRYFWRRDRIASVFFRFGLAFRFTVEEKLAGAFGEDLRRTREMVDELLALPQPDRCDRILALERETEATRQASYARGEHMRASMTEEQKAWRFPSHGFFSTLDSRDLVEGFRCALDTDLTGSRALFLCDHANTMGLPALELARLAYPNAALREERLQGFDAISDWRETEGAIGFRATHSISDHYEALYG
jgi:hypothetical protein